MANGLRSVVLMGLGAAFVLVSPEPARAAGDSPWKASLPGGMTVELVGVAPQPAVQGTWWGPDGGPIAGDFDTEHAQKRSPQAGRVVREIAVRVTKAPADAHYSWKFLPNGSASFHPV